VVTSTENGSIAFLPASGRWPATGQAVLVTPLRVGRLRYRLLCLLLDLGEYVDPHTRAVATDATEQFAAVQAQVAIPEQPTHARRGLANTPAVVR
jgi:hypothetical protein